MNVCICFVSSFSNTEIESVGISKVLTTCVAFAALGSSTPGHESTDWRQALKLWNYCCRLAKYLLDEGLLDRHDFLSWIIELLDKRAPDDGLLRLVICFIC